MFPKESDSIKQHFGITGVQVGEFEEQLVTERTISANPFLVIILKNLGFSWFFFRMKRPKTILGWVMRCWMWSHLMSEGKFWNGEATQKVLSRGSQEKTNEAAYLLQPGCFVPYQIMKCGHSHLETIPAWYNNKTSLLFVKFLKYWSSGEHTGKEH